MIIPEAAERREGNEREERKMNEINGSRWVEIVREKKQVTCG